MAWQDKDEQEDGREDEDDDVPTEFESQRRYTLFLIDCCQSMLQPWTLPLYHDSDGEEDTDEREENEIEGAASEAEKTFLGKVSIQPGRGAERSGPLEFEIACRF